MTAMWKTIDPQHQHMADVNYLSSIHMENMRPNGTVMSTNIDLMFGCRVLLA